jgi:hypothetical protein
MPWGLPLQLFNDSTFQRLASRLHFQIGEGIVREAGFVLGRRMGMGVIFVLGRRGRLDGGNCLVMLVMLRLMRFFRRARLVRRAGVFGPLVSRQRSDHHDDVSAVELGLKIRMAKRRNLAQKFSDHFKSDLGVGHFAAPEFQRHFHLHILAQEIDRMGNLDAQIMRIDARA